MLINKKVANISFYNIFFPGRDVSPRSRSYLQNTLNSNSYRPDPRSGYRTGRLFSLADLRKQVSVASGLRNISFRWL